MTALWKPIMPSVCLSLAASWLAAEPPSAEEWFATTAIISDDALFQALDLGADGLAPVRKAVEAKDMAGAKAALVKQLSSRLAPPDAANRPLNPKADTTVADLLVEHKFSLLGKVFDLGPDIDWDDKKQQIAPGESTQGFSRGVFFPQLADAYWTTGNEKYVKAFLELFHDHRRKVRPPAKKPAFNDRNAGWYRVTQWRCLNTICRQGALLGAYRKVCLSPALTVDDHVAVTKSLLELGRFHYYMNTDVAGGNGQIIEGVLMTQLANAFPEFREGQAWKERMNKVMDGILDRDVLADGGQSERCPGYGLMSTRNFVDMLLNARREGVRWDKIEKRVQDMMSWAFYAAMPCGEVFGYAPIGDCGFCGGAEETFLAGAFLFHSPEAKWLAPQERWRVRKFAEGLFGETAGRELAAYDAIRPEPPKLTSVVLPDTGWAIMRSDWSRDALAMLLDYGVGPDHCHADQASFNLYAYGVPLVTECAMTVSDYGDKRWPEWDMQTIAHNTIVLDGKSQTRGAKGKLHKWVTTPRFDYLHVSHDGYAGVGAVHHRKVIFVKPEYWIMWDVVEPTPGAGQDVEHDAQWVAHFHPAKMAVNEETKAVTAAGIPGKPSIVVWPLDRESITVEQKKSHKGVPRGRYHPPADDPYTDAVVVVVDDAPHVTFNKRAKLPITYTTVLYPYRRWWWHWKGGMDHPPLSVERVGSPDTPFVTAVRVTLGDITDVVFFSHGNEGVAQSGQLSFAAEAGYLRQEAGGLTRMFLVDGRSVEHDGNLVFDAKEAIGHIDVQNLANRVEVDGADSGSCSVALGQPESLAVHGKTRTVKVKDGRLSIELAKKRR